LRVYVRTLCMERKIHATQPEFLRANFTTEKVSWANLKQKKSVGLNKLDKNVR
jgi:hypothetical protein